jgi:hypothetical protein
VSLGTLETLRLGVPRASGPLHISLRGVPKPRTSVWGGSNRGGVEILPPSTPFFSRYSPDPGHPGEG